MTRLRIRIGTPMLLVVIAALTVALVVQHRRAEYREAALRRQFVSAEYRHFADADFIAWADRSAERAEKGMEGQLGTAAAVYGLEPVVLSAHVESVASDDLRVPCGEVLEDLLAIADGLPRPVDIAEASTAYIVHRREKKRGRAEAAREDLELSAMLDKAVAKWRVAGEGLEDAASPVHSAGADGRRGGDRGLNGGPHSDGTAGEVDALTAASQARYIQATPPRRLVARHTPSDHLPSPS